MKKILVKSLALSLVFYPFVVVLIAIIKLFQNESMVFMGFSLIPTLNEGTGNVSLSIDPVFLVSIIVLFVISFVGIYAIEKMIKIIMKQTATRQR